MVKTGIKDKVGKLIYIGSKVITAWGWIVIPGKPESLQTIFKYHTIRKKKNGNNIVYRLGTCYNNWQGRDVIVADKSIIKILHDLDIKEDDHGFFMINGVPVKPKPHELVGMMEHEYEKIQTEYREAERKIWFGK